MFEDGGIIRRIKRKGEGYSNPNEGATVESECWLLWREVLWGRIIPPAHWQGAVGTIYRLQVFVHHGGML